MSKEYKKTLIDQIEQIRSVLEINQKPLDNLTTDQLEDLIKQLDKKCFINLLKEKLKVLDPNNRFKL